MLLASVSLAAMLLRSLRDCICRRKLLLDVGNGEAPNADIRSDSFRGVEWLAVAAGAWSLKEEPVSIGKGEVEEEKSRSVKVWNDGNHRLRSNCTCF